METGILMKPMVPFTELLLLGFVSWGASILPEFHLIHCVKQQLLGVLQSFSLSNNMTNTMWSHMEFMYLIPWFVVKFNFTNVFIWLIMINLRLDDSIFITHEKVAGIRYEWFVKCEVRVFSKCSRSSQIRSKWMLTLRGRLHRSGRRVLIHRFYCLLR